MKLTTIILMLSLLQVSAASYGQNLTMQQKNVKISRIFLEIRKQTGYDVILPYSKFTETRFNADFKDTPVEQVMDELLSGTDYNYSIKNKTIVINAKEPSFRDRAADPFANITVHGHIYDVDGIVLRGATVTIKGTAKFSLTNEQGEFFLENVDENATLQITYVGFTTVEVKAAKELGKVILKLADARLKEVSVVSTGFQTIPKERATGSFSKIDNATYNRQVSTDVISRLKGIAPSMYFDERSSDGTINLNIRGQSTIFGNSKPLIVVDNFPFDGDLNNLNPNDVQDITILKDAAAASIWGVRAGNGVIVITTKKGRYNQPMNIEFNSNITVGSRPDLFYQPKMNPSDFIDVEQMLFDKGFYNSSIDNTFSSPVLSPVVEILLNQRNNTITADHAKSQIDALRKYDLRDDLSEYFFQQTLKQQYAFNLNGGTEKHNYSLSAGFDKNKLSAVKNDFSRLVINGNQSFRPIKNLEISTGIYFNQNISNSNNSVSNVTSGMGGGFQMYPYAKLADESGNPLAVNKDYRNSFKNSAAQQGYLDWNLVPLNELNLQEITNKLTGTRLSAGINYKFITGLSADVKFQYEHQNSENSFVRSPDAYYVRDLINKYTNGTGTTMKRNVPLGGTAENAFNSLNSLNGRAQINYDRTWSSHQLSVIAGFEARQVRANGVSNLLYGYDQALGTSGAVNYDASFVVYPGGYLANIPRGDFVTGTLDRFRSYYSNASYTLLNRYTVSASARIDQSNLFGVNANQRAVPLWSSGLKWDISKESFYALSWLPRLSLRGTYGYNGNLDNTLTAYTTATLGRSDTFGTSAAQLRNPPNANLRWERTGQLNIGIDFSSKNEELSGSVEYYSKQGKDLIGQGRIDPTTGFTSYKGNVANMSGKGVDIELQSINFNNTFRWTSNYLFSYTLDKVKDYQLVPTRLQFVSDQSVGRSSTNYSPVSGRPLFGIYSTPWAGLDPTTGAPRGFVSGAPSVNYTAIEAEIASDFANKLIYNGPALAPYFGALRNTLGYKNFELSFNITYRFGYYFRKTSINYGALYSQYETHDDYYMRWQKTGDEKTTNVPAMKYPADAAADEYYRSSEILIAKGDNIRLQDATLNYTFSRNQIRSLPFQNIKVFAYANNVALLWSDVKNGIDPDFPTNNSIRTIAFGLRCTY